MSTMTITHANSSWRASRLTSFLALAVSLPWAWRRRVRQRRELMGLLGQSDYLLKDVGLQRHEITREALKPFWRD